MSAPAALETPMTRAQWIATLERMGQEQGRFEALGDAHWSLFNEDGETLLVTFDRLETILTGQPGQMPFPHDLATRNGWSHLALICEGNTWFRDAAVFACFDRMVDDCFFDRFDRVVFFGAGMAGHAACAFSVAAPGAQVLAVQPRATMDPRIAGWDGRDRAARRLDFTERYGYAPDMIDGAGKVWLAHDPLLAEDAMHAALFRAPHVHALRCPFTGQRTADALAQMGALEELIRCVVEDRLTPAAFARIWRGRRTNGIYLRRILAACNEAGKPAREAAICRSVVTRLRAPAFRRRLTELEAAGANVNA